MARNGGRVAMPAAAIRSWGNNAVTLGLNEDCWLGINGVSSAYGGANYINAIRHEVATLEASGIYPVLSLFWEAPGLAQAMGQTAMPDNDHAPAFWQSVANTFKNDPKVIFRLKEEPYPAGNTVPTFSKPELSPAFSLSYG